MKIRAGYSVRLLFTLLTLLLVPPRVSASWFPDGVTLSEAALTDSPLAFSLDGDIAIAFSERIPRAEGDIWRATALVVHRWGEIVSQSSSRRPEDGLRIIRSRFAAHGDGTVAVAMLEETASGSFDLRVDLLDPRGSTPWPAVPEVVLEDLDPYSDEGGGPPEFGLARTESGRIVVSGVLGGQTHLVIIEPDGSARRSLLGLDESRCAYLYPRAGEDLWLVEEWEFVDRPYFRVLSADSGTLSEPAVLSRTVVGKPGARVGEIQSDGEGGLWILQRWSLTGSGLRDPALRTNHVDADGELRWSFAGQDLAYGLHGSNPNFDFDLEVKDADVAFALFTRDLSDAWIIRLDENASVTSPKLRMATSRPGIPPRIRPGPGLQFQAFWQFDHRRIHEASLSWEQWSDDWPGVLSEGYELSSALGAHYLAGATALRDHWNLLFLRDEDPRYVTETELTILRDELIPQVRRPEDGDRWFEDQLARIVWRSAGEGVVDIDLSLDGGTNWTALARSLPDVHGEFEFSVPRYSTREAMLRVSRPEFDLIEVTPEFTILPRLERFGPPVGSLQMSFEPDERRSVGTMEPLTATDIYLLSRVDFGEVGLSERNGEIGVGAWEAGLALPDELIVLESEVLGPSPVNVSPIPDSWVVGFGGTLPSGPHWSPLLRYRVMLLHDDSEDLRVDIGPSDPSSFDNFGGPGLVPGWLERPASGDCPEPCIRAFAGSLRPRGLLINAGAASVPVVRMLESEMAERNSPVVVGLQIDDGPIPEADPWTRLELVLRRPDLVAEIQDVRGRGDAEVDWNATPEFLRIVLTRHAAVSGAPPVEVDLHLRAGAELGENLLLALSLWASDASGRLLQPVSELQTLRVVEQVPIAISGFDVWVEGTVATLVWQAATRDSWQFRATAIHDGQRRALESSAMGSDTWRALDPEFGRGVDRYVLEGRSESSDEWIELASKSAPSWTTARLSLEAQPNPGHANTTFRWSGASGGVVELGVYDLRGRLVRDWKIVPTEGSTGRLVWDGRDADGFQVAAGVYFVQLRFGDRVVREKITRLR